MKNNELFQMKQSFLRALTVIALCVCSIPSYGATLRIVTTLPDYASLASSVGGAKVSVVSLVKGVEDPHHVVARPSFVVSLRDADLLIETGMELEDGWLVPLKEQSRNARFLDSTRGLLIAAQYIDPLNVPTGIVTRLQGDVHAAGNPHFLLDPISGLRVARAIADRLSALDSGSAGEYQKNLLAFEREFGRRFFGESLAKRYDSQKLLELYLRGDLEQFLRKQGQSADLGGWLQQAASLRGLAVLDDHDLWPYFAKRFGISIVEHLEPKPGIPPSARHLSEVIERAKTQAVRLVLTSPYFDPRHARFVAEKGGLTIVPLAHQVGSREGIENYLALTDYNLRVLSQAAGRK